MKKTFCFVIFLVLFFPVSNSYSQSDPGWSIGIGAGGVLGINEAVHQSLNPQFHLYGLWLNGPAPHLSLELGIGWAKISSPNQGGYSDYSTNFIPIDLRLRYAPLEDPDWQPYVYAGLGLLSYNVISKSNQASPQARLSGAAAFVPLGIGIYSPRSKNVAIDLNIGIHPSFSDDLNPVHDSHPDGYWGFTIGITYSFGEGHSRSSDEYDIGERGTTLILRGVTFDSSTAEIRKESDAELSKVLATLENHPGYEVEFRSYTDDSDEFNASMALTHDRGESVKIWFVSRGISAARISTQGYGPHNPLFPNDSPENREKNRRLEIVRMK